MLLDKQHKAISNSVKDFHYVSEAWKDLAQEFYSKSKNSIIYGTSIVVYNWFIWFVPRARVSHFTLVLKYNLFTWLYALKVLLSLIFNARSQSSI